MSKIDWTEEKLQYIREHYPTETAQDIADVIGCSDCTVNVKAKMLGVVKASSFRKSDFHGRYVRRGVINGGINGDIKD